MLKNIFPKEILDLIFSFDPTYHLKYKDLQLEFFKKTPYWNITNDIMINNPKVRYKYTLTYTQAKKLEHYWNNDYLINNIRINPNYKFIKIQEYLPYFFLQAQEIFLKNKGKQKLDTEGSCYYWCHYFLKLRLKFPDMDIKKLAEKCIQGITDSKKTDIRRLIRNHAQHIERLAKKEYPQLEHS